MHTKKLITKLSIFDFDGTLIDTPLPDKGRIEYQEKTGQPWPYEGWWGRHESLDMQVFDMQPVESVIEAYEQEIINPETIVVMLTGRMVKLSQHVETILHTKGFKFDEYHYNRGGTTFEAKISTLEKLLNKYPDVTTISMWDDRQEHIDGFKAWGESHPRLSKFEIHLVPADRH